MICSRTLRKISTYPFRFARVSRQIATKKPHKIRTSIKNVTLQCAPGIVSEVMNEALAPVKSSTPQMIEHYIIGICINAVISTVIYSALDKFEEND